MLNRRRPAAQAEQKPARRLAGLVARAEQPQEPERQAQQQAMGCSRPQGSQPGQPQPQERRKPVADEAPELPLPEPVLPQVLKAAASRAVTRPPDRTAAAAAERPE